MLYLYSLENALNILGGHKFYRGKDLGMRVKDDKFIIVGAT